MENNECQSVIDNLLNASPAERPNIISAIYKKNRAFFKKNMRAIDQFLENSCCPYRIDITDRFLNIVNEKTGEIGHPEAGLDIFSKMMGDWVHDAWVDLFNFKVASKKEHNYHMAPLERLLQFVKKQFPVCVQNYSARRLNLKEIGDGKRFSPPVIFLGIFSGLHIEYFLSRTVVPAVLMVEPDSERFEVSCYFLDYEEIHKRVRGRFFISLGKNYRTEAIQNFFHKTSITPLVWTRVLPGYVIPQAAEIIENFKVLQRIRSDIFFPIDYDIKGIVNGFQQIKKHRMLLSDDIWTSKQCRIAIVATGPSLINDLDWLRDNQNKVIIFAVHSSIKVLRQHGIVPDFQFCLDIHWESSQNFIDLDFCIDKPLIQYYKVTDEYFKVVENVLLVAEKNRPNPVIFNKLLVWTHPSTTCLAFSFADYCSPQEIFLLGCDFGYRSVENDHVQGSFYDKLNENSGGKINTHYGLKEQAMMPSNFNDAEFLQTATFLSLSRMVVESCIESTKNKYKVYNLSDGVAIRRAAPKRSKDVHLPKYEKKQKDINKIMRAFKRAEQNKNWRHFADAGFSNFSSLKFKIIEGLSITPFSWVDVAHALDTVITKEFEYFHKKNDTRMDIYAELITALLTTLYWCLIFMDSEKEAAMMYKEALDELNRIFEEDLFWPEELDS